MQITRVVQRENLLENFVAYTNIKQNMTHRTLMLSCHCHRPDLIFAQGASAYWPKCIVGEQTQSKLLWRARKLCSEAYDTSAYRLVWKHHNSPKSLCSVMRANESVLSRRTGVNWSLLYCAKAEPAFSLSKVSFFSRTRTSLKTSLNSPKIAKN